MRYYPWGGSEELWHQTALYAKRKGHETEVHVHDLAKGHERIRLLEETSIPVYFRNSTMSFKDRIFRKLKADSFNPSSYTRYWRKHIRNKETLVVISQGSSYDCLYVPELFDALQKIGCPYVLINQHNYEHAPMKEANIHKARTIFKNASSVYFVAKRNLDVAEKQLAATIDNGEVIYNPVKTTEYIAYPPADDCLQVACVARLECFNKGQDILLEILSQKKWRERNLVINFYGKGPDAGYLKSLAVFYGVTDKAHFKGHVENVEEIWKNNSCLLMSSFAEGTPLSLLEAMACGRPAVVTDVGGNAEWIDNKVSGFIADAPTAKLLDIAMEEMWQNRRRLQEMGLKARETFETKFPGDAVAYFYNRLSAISDREQPEILLTKQ